jgi:phage terminase large subunit GpA-like protein
MSGLYRLSKSEEFRHRKLLLGNTSSAKELLGGMLGVETPGPGYVHFPVNADGTDAEGFSTEFFAQLKSEKKELVVNVGCVIGVGHRSVIATKRWIVSR